MSLGALLIGIGFASFGITTSFYGAAVCVVIWTFGEMALISSSSAYISKIAGRQKGKYMGLYYTAFNFAAFIGPLGGYILKYNASLLWMLTLILGSFSAFLLIRHAREPVVAFPVAPAG